MACVKKAISLDVVAGDQREAESGAWGFAAILLSQQQSQGQEYPLPSCLWNSG